MAAAACGDRRMAGVETLGSGFSPARNGKTVKPGVQAARYRSDAPDVAACAPGAALYTPAVAAAGYSVVGLAAAVLSVLGLLGVDLWPTGGTTRSGVRHHRQSPVTGCRW